MTIDTTSECGTTGGWTSGSMISIYKTGNMNSAYGIGA